jgi:hypothetical protein
MVAWLLYVAGQMWPNLAANVVWIPLAWAWSRWHHRHVRNHLAVHRAEFRADLAAHRKALATSPDGTPGGGEPQP